MSNIFLTQENKHLLWKCSTVLNTSLLSYLSTY